MGLLLGTPMCVHQLPLQCLDEQRIATNYLKHVQERIGDDSEKKIANI